jgi:CheY-like chemotaxis protein
MDAIESLKPNAGVPSRAHAWRIYQVLYSRYVEQFAQKEVAAELGLSVRQIRREESIALEALASYLWRHYDLGSKWQDRTDISLLAEEQTNLAGTQTPSRKQELKYLEESLPTELVDAEQLIESVLEIACPLAQASRVHLNRTTVGSLPQLHIQHGPVRQALLILITLAIRSVPGGQVLIRTRVEQSQVHILIQSKGPGAISGFETNGARQLSMARQLVELSEGSLEVAPDQRREHFPIVQITLPAREQIPVLVIDDHADTLRLLERYLSNSRYQFIGTSDPGQAVQLASQSSPRIIVLDVMLPDIDGWELLGRLHEHPQISHVPIIVCTILPQRQLALSLGAAGFIRKPISRRMLLSALNRQLVLPSRES